MEGVLFITFEKDNISEEHSNLINIWINHLNKHTIIKKYVILKKIPRNNSLKKNMFHPVNRKQQPYK